MDLIFFIITFAAGHRSKLMIAHLKAYCVAFHSNILTKCYRHLAQCQQRFNVVDPKNPAAEFSGFGLTAPDPPAMPISIFFQTRVQPRPTTYQKLSPNSGTSGHQISQTVLAIFAFFPNFLLKLVIVLNITSVLVGVKGCTIAQTIPLTIYSILDSAQNCFVTVWHGAKSRKPVRFY